MRSVLISVVFMTLILGCELLKITSESDASATNAEESRASNISELTADKRLVQQLREDPHLSVQHNATDGSIIVVIRSGNLFNIDGATLSSTFTQILDRIVEIIIMNTAANYEITSIGHTDEYGDPQFNMMVSKKRAEAVQDYLVSKGIDRTLTTIEGKGSQEQIASSKTVQGRNVNRRVDLLIRLRTN